MGSQPVFVVGAMRSGTTMMRLMLSRHSSLAIPPESHFLAELFGRFEPDASLTPTDLDEAIGIITGNREWRLDWHGDPDAARTRLQTLAPSTVPDLIDAVFSHQIEDTGKPRWGDKTPAYLFQVERLRRAFPDARFVAMVRDPRDVYLSLAPRGWVGDSTWQVGGYLLRCGRLTQRLARGEPDDFCVIRYEDLVTATETTLRRVCQFLSLDYESEMRDFHEDAADQVQQWELDGGTHGKLLRPSQNSDVARWRREGSSFDRREIEAVTYEIITAFGYEVTLPRAAVRPLATLARLRHHARNPRQSATALRDRLHRQRFTPVSTPQTVKGRRS